MAAGFAVCLAVLPFAAQADREPGPSQSAADGALVARTMRTLDNRHLFFHGDTFRFGTVTLGDLKRYCAGIQAFGVRWHLASVAELEPMLPAFAHGRGAWSDFSALGVQEYVLVTATAQQAMGGRYFASVYRLLGNTAAPQLNYLGIGTINYSGDGIDTSPLTDNNGNQSLLKVICAADGH